MKIDDRQNETTEEKPASKRRLWLWFVVGFLVVFLVMSFAMKMLALHPSGQFARYCPLWKYYIIEIRRAMGPSSRMLGPTSGCSAAAITVAFQHILCSAVGGFVSLGMDLLSQG
ncbi:MAG: hypothetical protein PVH19_12840 [Planctomycetia bacterium]|jgi:hypothetical protein